jgi:TonB-dependent receptor
MKKLITLILILFTGILFSQQAVRGTVSDENGNSMPGAYIQLEATNFSTISDIHGKYMLTNIPVGKHILNVSYIGYANKKIEIDMTKDKTLINNIIMDEGVILKEVVINAHLEGIAKAMNAQKNKVNITDVISFEQIEKYPDANMGDALKRLAGINVQYDQGEARFANIRGTAPELSSITINGERVPSAEAEKRYVQLDLIPSDMIETVEVNKAVTSDMDGDAIGGSINLIMEKAKEFKIKGSIGSGYSFLSNKPLYKGKLTVSNRFANDKIGLILNASILDKYVRSDNIEAEWDYSDKNNKDATASPVDFQIRQYFLERLRQSYSAILDFQLSENHNIYMSGMYNWRNDWENRFRVQYKNIKTDGEKTIAEIRRQTKGGTKKNARLEDQRMIDFGVGGEHFFNNLKMTWSLTSMKASEDRPNERYINMNHKKSEIGIDLSDLTKPAISVIDNGIADYSSEFGLKELTEEFQYTEEKDLNGKIDFELPVMKGINSSNIKFGVRMKNKEKIRENQFYEYEPSDEDGFLADALANSVNQTKDNFMAGDYKSGSFVSEKFLGSIDLTNGFEGEELLEAIAGNFTASENVYAGYLMYNQNLSQKISLLGGLRFEMTQLKAQGKIFDGENLNDSGENSSDYTNILPGFHVRYAASKFTNLRFAWTNTLARPNYYDLVPYQQIETDDNYITVGNSDLKATTSMNFDVLGEHYFPNLGLISAGIFYKNLTNVIATTTKNDFTFKGHLYDRYSQPQNAGNADLFGFEIALQRRLDFLPSVFKHLTLNTNYTYTYSKLKEITIENREGENLPLVGTPKNILNASISYDTKRFDLRISYNFAGSFIEAINDEKFYDRWYDKVNYLDFNMDYKFSKNWNAYLSLNNLLNQPLRYYQGIHDRTMQVEYYGVHAKIGVKFEF